MLVVGDLHLSDNRIKKLQTEAFVDWLIEQDVFKNSKNIIFEGDLFEVASPGSGLVSFYLNLFANRCPDKMFYIVEGNHDVSLAENALNYFTFLKNVKLITEHVELEIEGKKCLFLPHYDFENTDKPPMYEVYSKLSGKYDYIFGHIMDETQSFGNKKTVCDLSNLQGTKLFGHVHSPNKLTDGNYLGSAVKNSSTEKDDQKILAYITETGCEYVNVPSFMEFETVNYGEEPKNTDKLVLLNILDAPTKHEAETYYESKYPKAKCNKVITRRKAVLETQVVERASEEASWEAFCKEKDLPENVKRICEKVLTD